MGEGINKTNANSQEDAALIEAFKAKDETAFDKLVIKYKDKVYNLCYCLLGNHEEADDSAQEVFIKVYRSIKNFKFESSFSTWLYRISVNTCKNKLVSMRLKYDKRMVRLDSPKDPVENSGPIYISDPAPSPIVELERKEKEALILNAINSLPEEGKELVVLRDIEGLPYEEIARITGYKDGTMKSKLARARLMVKEKLKGFI